MRRQRKDFVVDVEGAVPQVVVIKFETISEARRFRAESMSGDVVARCDSAKRLSDWALFEKDALKVIHDYDLKLSDDEF